MCLNIHTCYITHRVAYPPLEAIIELLCLSFQIQAYCTLVVLVKHFVVGRIGYDVIEDIR